MKAAKIILLNFTIIIFLLSFIKESRGVTINKKDFLISKLVNSCEKDRHSYFRQYIFLNKKRFLPGLFTYKNKNHVDKEDTTWCKNCQDISQIKQGDSTYNWDKDSVFQIKHDLVVLINKQLTILSQIETQMAKLSNNNVKTLKPKISNSTYLIQEGLADLLETQIKNSIIIDRLQIQLIKFFLGIK